MSPPRLSKFDIEQQRCDSMSYQSTAGANSSRCSPVRRSTANDMSSPDGPLNLCKAKSRRTESASCSVVTSNNNNKYSRSSVSSLLSPTNQASGVKPAASSSLASATSCITTGSNSRSGGHSSSSRNSRDEPVEASSRSTIRHTNSTGSINNHGNDLDTKPIVAPITATNFAMSSLSGDVKLASPSAATPLASYFNAGLSLDGRCLPIVPSMGGVLAAAQMVSLSNLSRCGLGSLDGASALFDKVNLHYWKYRLYLTFTTVLKGWLLNN